MATSGAAETAAGTSSKKEEKHGDLLFQAKLAEQAERYKDMVDFMKKIVDGPKNLSVEERNLLSVAYKNVVGARRAAWRVISSLLATEGRAPMEKNVLADYKIRVEGELKKLCGEILQLLDQTLIPNSAETEEKVFYLKMAGDYYRYLAEFEPKEVALKLKGESSVEKAKDYYQEATEVGYTGVKGKPLAKTNPILLGLTLNYSVFHYEILNKPEKACQLAKAGFDQAVDELDALEEESYKDATLIMQLLRDNLTLWTSSSADDNYDAETEELGG